MPSLKDSSEIDECARLLRDLLPPGGIAEYLTFDQPAFAVMAEHAPRPETEMAKAAVSPTPSQAPPAQEAKTAQAAATIAALESGHKEDRLENALEILCQRGGFSSAVIADDQGLALADHNSPVDTEILAAFATVLGGAIAQASHFLDQHEANNISMDINYADKAVVRKFEVRSTPFYLFIICPQDVDERNEVELSLETIMNMLNR